MNRSSTTVPSSFGNLDLLLDKSSQPDLRWRLVFGGSLLLHLVAFVVFMTTPEFVSKSAPPPFRQKIAPLYLPPSLLTQKAPNRQQPSRSIDLAALMSPAPSTPRAPHFELPAAAPARQPAMPVVPPAPQVPTTSAVTALPPGAANGLPQPVAPPPPSPTKPFQNLGDEDHADIPKRKIAVPNASVDNAIKTLAPRANGNGRTVVSDAGSPGSLGTGSAPHTEVELQSDPEGADFREYLTRILGIVRANWRQVLPESARMGLLRGSTVIEFAINRDGSIPKLVTADESGSRALDTAAVAGLSMSNPLPPLPPDFKGQQVRIAFTFSVQGKQ